MTTATLPVSVQLGLGTATEEEFITGLEFATDGEDLARASFDTSTQLVTEDFIYAFGNDKTHTSQSCSRRSWGGADYPATDKKVDDDG